MLFIQKKQEKLEKNKGQPTFRWFLFTHPFNLKELLVVFYPLIKKKIDLIVMGSHGTSGIEDGYWIKY
jgi:hypothetical protein